MSALAFDLDEYCRSYAGFSKLQRLHFIATKSEEFREAALKKAFKELMGSSNTVKYEQMWQEFRADQPKEESVEGWLAATKANNARRIDKLKADLRQMPSPPKESMKIAYKALAEAEFAAGQHQDALKSYMRVRDYVSSDVREVVNMCLDVIQCGLAVGNYSHVNNFVNKADACVNEKESPADKSKLKAAASLVHIHNGNFRGAAQQLLGCSVEMGNSFNQVVTCTDIAVYGTLCALASFDRADLKTKLIDNNDFKLFLELVPDVREIVHNFYVSRYHPCLEALERRKAALSLDVHVGNHVEKLYEQIRSKALMQYFLPYQSVRLDTMADAFHCDMATLETELSKLIMAGSIKARMDSHDKIMTVRKVAQPDATYNKVIKLGQKYQQNALIMLLRANCIKHGFAVKRGDDAANRTQENQ